ncbi:glycoside hydrolase N-terminal domain-containing protein [Streptomyces cyaneochromogenes]|uniref:glycoside hydrolase N-terminal domain-containing protein n=1 Tax=Streptomyces cyaneochromogenes TaxID=2496836 RepID=UPI001E40B25B|nr:glycoside hydrolase N-terminal domain-containing protein [Streptomyces cyaneochromogenes]
MIAGCLEGARDKALAGDYAGANRDYASGWSLRWTQVYHPAYELRIGTPGMTTVNNYGRVTDFRTGEVSSSWTDQFGTWTRRAFVSRADKPARHLPRGAGHLRLRGRHPRRRLGDRRHGHRYRTSPPTGACTAHWPGPG